MSKDPGDILDKPLRIKVDIRSDCNKSYMERGPGLAIVWTLFDIKDEVVWLCDRHNPTTMRRIPLEGFETRFVEVERVVTWKPVDAGKD